MEPRLKTFDLAIFNTQEGRLRLLSASILAPVFLAVVILGGASYAGLVALMMAVGLYEWLRLVDPAAPVPDRYVMHASLLAAIILAAAGMPNLGLIVVVMASVAFYAHRSNIDPVPAFWFALGLPYMAVSGIALIYLRAMPVIGASITLYLLAVVWGMDIGAYVVGRLVGGPKLAPEISPNKTWSGFIGGMVSAAVLSLLVLLFSGAHSVFTGLVVALVLAAAAQGGDLFKSFFKRRAGVKDCGNLIPGHGGVLDRIDGLVFSALILAFLQAIFGAGMIW